MANSFQYISDFETTLQRRFAHPTTWKDVVKAIYTDKRTITEALISTVPATQALTRGTANAPQDFALSTQNLTLSTDRELGTFFDWADYFQTGYNTFMEVSEIMGDLMNEYIESNLLAQHASWTDFDNASIGGAAGNITVSTSNVDEIARGIRREIREGNGGHLMKRNGAFGVVRAADMEKVEAFAQANGFNLADGALKSGVEEGLHYLGINWYWSNETTSGHLFAGVRGLQKLGVLNSLHGRLFEDDFPAGASGNPLSGKYLEVRETIGHLTPTTHLPLLYDVLVA